MSQYEIHPRDRRRDHCFDDEFDDGSKAIVSLDVPLVPLKKPRRCEGKNRLQYKFTRFLGTYANRRSLALLAGCVPFLDHKIICGREEMNAPGVTPIWWMCFCVNYQKFLLTTVLYPGTVLYLRTTTGVSERSGRFEGYLQSSSSASLVSAKERMTTFCQDAYYRHVVEFLCEESLHSRTFRHHCVSGQFIPLLPEFALDEDISKEKAAVCLSDAATYLAENSPAKDPCPFVHALDEALWSRWSQCSWWGADANGSCTTRRT